MQVLPGKSRAIVFVPNQPNVFIRLTNIATEWWNLEGRMLHRFYTLNVPASLSICPDGERNFRVIITDEHGYTSILSPHNPALQNPEEIQVDGVMNGSQFEVRLRERPTAYDAARFFFEMKDYPADYLVFWKYWFSGDRGHVFPVFFSDTQPCEMIEDTVDKTLRYMRTLVNEMEAEIRQINRRGSLAISFSTYVEEFPTVNSMLEPIFTTYTDRVNKLVAQDQ